MEDTFPLRLRSSTLGGGGVSLDGLKTSSTVAELQKLIQLKSLISPADQKKQFSIHRSEQDVLFGFPPKELIIQDAVTTLAVSNLTKNDVLIVSSRSGQTPGASAAANAAIANAAAAFRPDSAAAFAARKAQESQSNANSRKRKEPTPAVGFGVQVRTLSDIKPRLLPGHRINEDGDEEIVVAKRRKTKADKPLPALPGLKIMGFIVNSLPNGWYTVDTWLEPPHIVQLNFFSVGPITGRFPIYQPLRYTSATPLSHNHMRRWHIQLEAVQTLDEELSSFGANLHPSQTELVGKCLLKLRKFSQQTQRVISIAEQPAEASSQSSSSGGKRAASATNSNEIHEVPITEVSGSKPTAVRKWESVEDMPVNLMKDILKSFGEKGLSDLDRDDLVKEIKLLLQTKSLRTNSSSDD